MDHGIILHPSRRFKAGSMIEICCKVRPPRLARSRRKVPYPRYIYLPGSQPAREASRHWVPWASVIAKRWRLHGSLLLPLSRTVFRRAFPTGTIFSLPNGSAHPSCADQLKSGTHYQLTSFFVTTVPDPLSEAWKGISLGQNAACT